MDSICFELHRKDNGTFIFSVYDREGILAFQDDKVLIDGDTYRVTLSSRIKDYLKFDDVEAI